mgnify:CR=1 FL=1
MSEQYISFEARQAKKKDKQRREEIRRIAGLLLGAVAAGAWLISIEYVDNPFDAHQDSSISVEDNSANK